MMEGKAEHWYVLPAAGNAAGKELQAYAP